MSLLAITRAPSWAEVAQVFVGLPGWAFRGQSDATWELETTLYREAQRLDRLSKVKLSDRESWLLYQFGRYAHQHMANLPPKEDILDWFALIQHYGGPTRLLDFTYSFLVAAFFAIETARTDAAVWAICRHELNAATQKHLAFEANGSIHEVRRTHNATFQEAVVSKSLESAVIHVEPDKVNERLWIQQGLFLAPINVDLPFMHNFAAMFGQDSSIVQSVAETPWSKLTMPFESGAATMVKIILPKDIHGDIRANLKAANINAATLFAGLEGFARSLRFFL